MCRRVQPRGGFSAVRKPALESLTACVVRLLLMLGELRFKALRVHLKPAFRSQLFGYFDRKAVSIVKPERGRAVYDISRQLFDKTVELPLSSNQRFEKLFLLLGKLLRYF